MFFYSAAVSGSPVMSPPSGACSTDSAGSSLSIDETDCCGHSLLEDGVGLTSRFIVPPETQVINLFIYFPFVLYSYPNVKCCLCRR